ncbi:hypothetical protein BDQ17DRAFT_1433824 [Cyathus striatus]|nr:hypothetical protein BDQ17DRAFT_1433824 [Cyathus striatus]
MALAGAHRFVINGNINAYDYSHRGDSGFMILVNEARPGAGHESAERADPLKCHSETRKKYIDEIMEWIDSPNEDKQIMWLNGPAGAGKSAIFQTIAERRSHEGKLLSSFFFS